MEWQDDLTLTDTNRPLLLRQYYARLFPTKYVFLWLNHAHEISRRFTHREFSFTLFGDIYMRYQSFKDASELRQELLRLCPVKIDIGAVYTVRPKEKKMSSVAAFVPVEKEFVLDIDMTDYDDVRTCCKGGDVCGRCWPLMTVAIHVLDTSLREDFGFQQRLWVYSGRRGVHCWVGDERARLLDNEARRAIVAWLVLVKGGAQQARKVNQKLNIHPAITRALDICTTAFEQCILKQQHILQTPEQWSKVLAIIPDETVSGALHTKWLSTEADSLARWQDLCDHVQHAVNTAPTNYALKTCLRDIVLQYCYPRLDDKVSTQLNHLLKAPFCIHPKTGRVCVPIDPLTCDTFDPLAVPTVSDLLRELQLHDAETSTVDTSLKPHIDAFKRFIQLDTRPSTLSLDY